MSVYDEPVQPLILDFGVYEFESLPEDTPKFVCRYCTAVVINPTAHKLSHKRLVAVTSEGIPTT